MIPNIVLDQKAIILFEEFQHCLNGGQQFRQIVEILLFHLDGK